MNDERELSRELTLLVSATPGVVEVYPSEPLVRTIARDLIALATDGTLDDARIKVTRDSSGATAVTAVIGVGVEHPVPETLRTVCETLCRYLVERNPDGPTPTVNVTVSRIDNAPLTV